MKKLFITLITISGLALSANAQEFGFKQGDILLEGNISIQSENDKGAEEKTSQFNFSPKAGYFLSDKFAVGLQLGLNSWKNEEYSAGNEEINKTNSLNIGVFGRYYFFEIGKRFKTFAEAGIGYGTSKSENEVGGTTTKGPKTNTLNFNAGVGANYFITERLALSVGLTDIINIGSEKLDVSGAKASTYAEAQIGSINNILDYATFGLAYKF